MAKKKKGIPYLREIAEKRMDKLLDEAAGCVKEREEDAVSYVKLAKKIAMRHRIAIKKIRKKKFCKKCNILWIEGYNLEKEEVGEWEIYRCKKCSAERKLHA
ncbi:MAG: hypothetical protein ABIH83_04705 [Candidatus Micrarchaeota archaeon]